MIEPEPNWACDLSDLRPGEAGENIPLPAAGRLGVTEEKCIPDEHAAYTIGYACPNCGAAV